MTSLHLHSNFPGGSDSQESACNTGDPGSIPGLGRSPGEGNSNPLQYSCLGNPKDRGDWLLSGDPHSLWRHRRSDMTEQLALTYTYIHLCMEVRALNEIFTE